MGAFFFAASLFVVLVMAVYARSVRTTTVLCGAYTCALGTAITYEAGASWWWILLVLFVILSVMSGVSIKIDRDRKEFQNWLDSLDIRRDD